MDSKPFWASKTIWVNGIAMLATLASVWGWDLGLDAAVQAEIVVGVMAIINIVLRVTTTKPVTAARPPEVPK